MEESLHLSLHQRQQQTLTPMQLQFVRMLEMNAPEAEDEVRRALDDNPALEAVDDSDTSYGNLTAEGEDFHETAEQMQLADYRTEDDVPSYRLEARNHSSDDSYYEPVGVVSGDSLMESVLKQLSENGMTDDDMVIAHFVAGNLDDNGYLTRTPAAIADDASIQSGHEITVDEVKRVWNAIRALDPAGIGAVDLRDCLLLQLRRRDASVPSVVLAIEIVTHYFDLFSRMHYERMQSQLGVSEQDFVAAVDVIKSLNPKPGSLIEDDPSADKTRHITPDFLVETEGDTITLTLLNHIPGLQIERSFAADIEVTAKNASGIRNEAAMFIRQKRDEAAAFIRVVEMRQATLYRVMSAIVKLQRDFFLTDDPLQLHPMILKDVAEITGDDLSVISRATAGKYVATSGGVYPLKFFFNERPKENIDSSVQEILAALRKIIEEEDKKRPLSDDAISRKLKENGYDIARRTVTKYREKLGLPVGRLRRGL